MDGSMPRTKPVGTRDIQVGDRVTHDGTDWVVESIRGDMLTVTDGNTTDHWSANYVAYAEMDVTRPPGETPDR